MTSTTTPPPVRPLPAPFFQRPAREVAPDLIGCLLVRRLPDGSHLWGVVVETEAYCQDEPACHGHRRRSPSNETLFGAPGRFYVYVSHGLHACVNVVTDRAGRADGVLLRAAALPGGPERAAAGPGLLARCFGIDRRDDGRPATPAAGLWLTRRPAPVRTLLAAGGQDGASAVVQTGRIGIRLAQDLPWRWYLRGSRSVSRRAPGDRRPRRDVLSGWLQTPTVGAAAAEGMA